MYGSLNVLADDCFDLSYPSAPPRAQQMPLTPLELTLHELEL